MHQTWRSPLFLYFFLSPELSITSFSPCSHLSVSHLAVKERKARRWPTLNYIWFLLSCGNLRKPDLSFVNMTHKINQSAVTSLLFKSLTKVLLHIALGTDGRLKPFSKYVHLKRRVCLLHQNINFFFIFVSPWQSLITCVNECSRVRCSGSRAWLLRRSCSLVFQVWDSWGLILD